MPKSLSKYYLGLDSDSEHQTSVVKTVNPAVVVNMNQQPVKVYIMMCMILLIPDRDHLLTKSA